MTEACESKEDLKTLGEWADHAHVSYTKLRECCRLAGMKPHAAHDFMRVLRAVMRSSVEGVTPDVLLDISDGRTLDSLLARGGLMSDGGRGPVSLEYFFTHQQFIRPENPALRLLRQAMGADGSSRPAL